MAVERTGMCLGTEGILPHWGMQAGHLLLPPLWALPQPLPPATCQQEQGTCWRLCPLHFGIVPPPLTHLRQPGWRWRWCCKQIFAASAKQVNSPDPFSGLTCPQSPQPRAVRVPLAGCEGRGGVRAPRTSRADPAVSCC